MPTLQSPSSSHSCQEDRQSSGSSKSASSMTSPVSSQHERFMTLFELSTTKMYRMELKTYLVSFLKKEASHGAPPKRITSRKKLSKLNNGQFLELARDVYDEMIRRTRHGNKDPFLPVHDEFHPRRNQARQKLATLPEHRFMDLSSDVYHELSRRYPHTKMEKNDALPPLPCPDDMMTNNNTVSNSKNEWFPQTVIPDKGLAQIDHYDTSSLVPPASPSPSHQQQQQEQQLRHDDQEYHAYSVHPLEMDRHEYDRQPNLDSSHTSSNWTDSLDSLIADIDSMVKPGGLSNSIQGNNATEGSTIKSPSSRANSNHSISEHQILQQYEQQITELKQRINELEQLTLDDKADTDVIEKCNRLEQENQKLIHQQRQQEEVVKKVKKETFELLNQLDTLSSKNGEIMADRDNAYQMVEKLQDEVKVWQSKHGLVQRQLDGLESSSLPSPSTETEDAKQSELILGIQNLLQPTSHGIISHKFVVAFQTSIEDLVKYARTNQRTDILPCIKSIVEVCKSISDQVDQNEANLFSETRLRKTNKINGYNESGSGSRNNSDGSVKIHDNKNQGSSSSSKKKNHAKLKNIRRQYSLALHHLLSASKGYVHGSDLYPLSLLDASVSLLTNIMIELIELLGVSD
ncbi:hypothetical protein BCR42DRAFT_403151 [Absidia repens]|uniref:GIT Spa2 homology (SHD) domain-containing protein n=1 Tax=Absidia repens TaxID=90262 RepID=A0A1X2IZ20_9FUNG|nr:hypothetical protein BCR42DRAFT_403151 [Absidia repens]